ncbi:MAG TPA: hypothetical protein VLK84_20310 [Longimicrobium sp.]|nr:hypothetical protein [Longimicrobium sp.]
MRKAKLSLDTLHVDTFETAAASPGARGTVHAHATFYGTCQGTCVDTCGGPTCDYPCQTANTCHLTCHDPCGWTYGYAVCKQTP